jgi:hypothetical protein
LYDPAKGGWFLKNANVGGNADVTFFFGPANTGWLPAAGDWDGDGKDTVGLFDPVNSTWYLRNVNAAGNADKTLTFGPGDAKPITGKWL